MINKNFTTIIAMTLLTGLLAAQSPKTQALLMALGTNAKQTATYQWKQRTTVMRKGNPAGTRIDEIRFDATGQPHRLTLVKPEEKKMGPLRARKANEIKDDVQDVMQLAARYSNPQELSQAIRKGEIWEGQGSLRVRSRSILLPVDEMMMTVNTASYLPTKIDFKTMYEGSPVDIAIDYMQLPNGPNMATRMTVRIPSDNIVVIVDSYDFVRLASAF